MLKQIEEFVLKNHMIEKDDRFVLGVSGGADSVCLFYVMLELKQKYNIEMMVVHVNHGIRGRDADEDEQFVKRLCERNHIPCECVHADVSKVAKEQKLSEEEAGRQVRYKAFEQAMKKYGCNKIAVAHNRNDQSETVLLNLFRGTGLKGLAGIEPVRGKIVRPLLQTGRIEIENYLASLGIQYQNDFSNFEDVYTRNKVRLRVLPYVEAEINTKASWHIAQTSDIMKEMCDFLAYEVERVYKQIVKKETGMLTVPRETFNKEHVVLRKELIRRMIFELSGKRKDVEVRHIESILELAGKGVGKKVDLPYSLECVNDYEMLVLRIQDRKAERIESQVIEKALDLSDYKGRIEFDTNGQLEWEVVELSSDKSQTIEKIKSIPKNDYTKCFDYDKIKNTVLLRNRKIGDFYQFNSAGSKKKLKEFFINEKIPSEKRSGILLLADGNHIMWIVGHRMSEYYKVDDHTRKILVVKINGGH